MKKYIVGAMALISLSISASAAVTPSAIPGIVVSESSCEDGYIITSSRAGTTKTAYYDSCLSDGIIVKDGSGDVVVDSGPVSLAETVTINGVEHHFPVGYTTPTVAANNTCAGGYDGTTADSFNCNSQNLSALSDGYLNLTSVGSNLYLNTNQLTNVDVLANLTSVGGVLYLYSNPNLQDLSGLNNLQSLAGVIYLDVRDYAVKLDASSYICQNFATKVISASTWGAYPNKSDICNP